MNTKLKTQQPAGDKLISISCIPAILPSAYLTVSPAFITVVAVNTA